MKKFVKSIKKFLKNRILSRFLSIKGYVINTVIETHEMISTDLTALDNDSVNVLVKDWFFLKEDHCYIEKISDEDADKLEIKDFCPLCDLQMHTITEIYGSEGALGLQTGQCKSCGFIKHTRNFNQDWFASHFKEKWLLSDTERENNVATKDFPYDEVSYLLEPCSNVLDIGCGIGDRLKKFKDNGMTVHGCDPSLHRTKVASSFLDSDIKTMGGEEFFAQNYNKYDLIYFYTCLHFTEDPFLLIRKAAESLKENSFIYIVDSRYGYHNLFHAASLGVARSYMSIKSIDILAKKLGLKIIKYESEPFLIILTNDRSAKNCRLDFDIDVDKYIISELYPKRHEKGWLKINYQPFNREIKFNVVDNDAKKTLKKNKVNYPVKFLLSDYRNPPLMLK